MIKQSRFLIWILDTLYLFPSQQKRESLRLQFGARIRAIQIHPGKRNLTASSMEVRLLT